MRSCWRPTVLMLVCTRSSSKTTSRRDPRVRWGARAAARRHAMIRGVFQRPGTLSMKLSMPRFDQAPVLVVGDVMLDRYWHGGTSRISPEAPVPVVKVEQIEEDRKSTRLNSSH